MWLPSGCLGAARHPSRISDPSCAWLTAYSPQLLAAELCTAGRRPAAYRQALVGGAHVTPAVRVRAAKRQRHECHLQTWRGVTSFGQGGLGARQAQRGGGGPSGAQRPHRGGTRAGAQAVRCQGAPPGRALTCLAFCFFMSTPSK